jgi:hypothetical protein
VLIFNFEVVAPKLIELHAALATSTAIVCPAAITTLSVEVGTAFVLQVEALLQFPDPVVVICPKLKIPEHIHIKRSKTFLIPKS